jgi:hypothetical protein
MRTDLELLREKYQTVCNNELRLYNEQILFEGAPEEITKAIPSGLNGFFSAWAKYSGMAILAGVATGIAANLFGWLIVGISKIINKDAVEEQRIRQEFIRLKNKNRAEALMDEDLTDEELYTEYKKIEGELADKLEEKFPLKGSEKWAIVLEKLKNMAKI